VFVKGCDLYLERNSCVLPTSDNILLMPVGMDLSDLHEEISVSMKLRRKRAGAEMSDQHTIWFHRGWKRNRGSRLTSPWRRLSAPHPVVLTHWIDFSSK
jgi:hypothetical protein